MAIEDDNREWNLWRRFNTAPYRRWAMTVEPADTESGYRIVDFDPSIADSSYLAQFDSHMAKPAQLISGGLMDGVWMTTMEMVQPGQEGHFQTVIRSVPGTANMPEGRPS